MMNKLIITIIPLVLWMAPVFAFEQQREVKIVYPKDHAVVYDKVNLVLDPTEIPFFQVIVGTTEYPIIDTSAGRHAYQGLTLKPGVNRITVRVFIQSPDPNKEELELVASREISVYNRSGLVTNESIPAIFREQYFHSREREANCSGCHELDVEKADSTTAPGRSGEVICAGCHRTIPVGNNIHDPVAAGDCMACHDPNLYPVKYQFTPYDPWSFSRDKLPVKPAVRSVAATELFEPYTDDMVAAKNGMRNILGEVVSHLKKYPDDKARLEVHTHTTADATRDEGNESWQRSGDNARLKMRANDSRPRKAGKKIVPFINNRALSEARARKLAAFFRKSGIDEDRFTVAAMGDKEAGASDATIMGPADDRVEIVLYPSDLAVESNLSLPDLKDRERIVVKLDYARGPAVRNLTVEATVPKGSQYLDGSALIGRRPTEPKHADNALIWELGDMSLNFSINLSYVVRRGKSSPPEEPEIRVTYAAENNAVTRAFNPNVPVKSQWDVEKTCKKCHKNITNGQFAHEPANAGHCDVCHNPHASSASSLLREPSWMLCTKCHTDKTGAHIIASHPTRGPQDPSRPGKQFSCVSCHNPHSANSKNLYSHNARERASLCTICHKI